MTMTSLARIEAARVQNFAESLIRESTRLAKQYGAINLAQGFPDFPCSEELKSFAVEAIRQDHNQYSLTWGSEGLRNAIANKARNYNSIHADPNSEITVVCGATEGMICAFLGLVDAGKEVIVFQPFYENYGPDAVLSGARPRYVRLREPDWSIDFTELEAAFNHNTAAIIINTPHNPTGKVFQKWELEKISDLCQKWNVLVFSDEIYEHILYDGNIHVSPGSIPGLEDRTVTINSVSKTFGVTGWRVGWVIAHRPLSKAIRKVHDFLTVCAATPLQEAARLAIENGTQLLAGQAQAYEERRNTLLKGLEAAGLTGFSPGGAYYIMADARDIFESNPNLENDRSLVLHLVRELGVAAVPGSAFYAEARQGREKLRFCFCKKRETLHAAVLKLSELRPSMRQLGIPEHPIGKTGKL
jgi:aspartate/methionine/tyrosine aminotransferase